MGVGKMQNEYLHSVPRSEHDVKGHAISFGFARILQGRELGPGFLENLEFGARITPRRAMTLLGEPIPYEP